MDFCIVKPPKAQTYRKMVMRTLAEIKADLIRAMVAGDVDRAKELTQEKERVKKLHFCVDCGLRIHRKALRCRICLTVYRNKNGDPRKQNPNQRRGCACARV